MADKVKKFGALAVLLVGLPLVWYVGNWLGLRDVRLWIVRIGLALICVAGAVGLWMLARQKKKKKTSGAGQGKAGPASVDDSQINALFSEAERRLASSGKVRTPKLGSLPVIVMLGETGATKTTTVARSGMEPELIAGEAFHDNVPVPTQAVNLWYSNQAVFAELGGNILRDRDARLKAFKRLAPAGTSAIFGKGTQPPRAAVICVDCESFFHAGAGESLPASARVIREALGDMCRMWGVNLPVYIVFTKLDRVPHFAEWASTLTNPEAGYVLGTTLSLRSGPGTGVYAEQETRRLSGAFQNLIYSLADKRTELLKRENDGEKLPAEYQFPRELTKLRNLLVPYLVEIGRPSQLSANPFLRGFYFNGVRPVVISDIPREAARPVEQKPLLADATSIFRPQYGAPAEMVSSPASARKVPQWVFLSHLFTEVVLKDGAALGSSSSSVKTDFWRRMIMATATLLALIFGIGWTVSYIKNEELKSEAVAAATALSQAQSPDATLVSEGNLQKLEALRVCLAKLRNYELYRPPMSLRWGLYAGHELYEPLFKIYFSQFRRLLLGGAQRSLLTLISRPSGAESLGYKPVYDALKAYLITTSHPEKSTTEFLPPVLMDHWSGGRPVEPSRGDLARRQFIFYAEQLRIANPYPTSSAPDMVAVQTARAYLTRFAALETLYQAMLARASERYATLRFNQQYPGSAEVVRNNYPVPGAFSKGGWAFMQEAIKNPDQYFSGERWVMGDQAYANLDRSKLSQDLQRRYRDDFLKVWREFLKITNVVRYAGIPDAAAKLTTLSGNQSPLLMVLCVVSQNTSVDAPDIAAVFQPAQFVTPPGCQDKLSASNNAAYMDGLIRLQASLQQLAGNASNDMMRNDTMNTATGAQVAARQVAQNFRIDKDGQTQSVVQKLLEDPITSVQAALVGVPAEAINGKGAGLCAQIRPLMTKYPFQAKATAQASLAEVGAIFQPQTGAIWRMYDENLTKLLVRQGNDFVPTPSGGLSVTPLFLNFFRQAVAVSNALYKGPQPQLTFTLTPHPTEGIQRVALTINGETKRSDSGSGPWQFVWPGNGPQEVKLTVTIAGGSELAYPGYSGLWAVSEFLANADKWQAAGNLYSFEMTLRTAGGPVTLPNSGKPVTVRFDLDMGSAPPILRPGYMSGLNCVSTVVK